MCLKISMMNEIKVQIKIFINYILNKLNYSLYSMFIQAEQATLRSINEMCWINHDYILKHQLALSAARLSTVTAKQFLERWKRSKICYIKSTTGLTVSLQEPLFTACCSILWTAVSTTFTALLSSCKTVAKFAARNKTMTKMTKTTLYNLSSSIKLKMQNKFNAD